jgi:hypothetical protein
LRRQVDIAEIDRHVAAHRNFQPVEVERAELVPFRDDDSNIRRLGRLARRSTPGDPRQKGLGILACVRIVGS